MHLAASKAQVRAPRQDRSRATFDRIIRGAETLLDGRDYETISVQEICEVAEVSPSSFYARFQTKEALLFELHDRHRKRRREKLGRYMSEIDWESLAPHQIVRACLALYIEERKASEPFFRTLLLAELSHPAIQSERKQIDDLGVRLIRGRLLERLESTDPALSQRIEFGMRAVCAAAQEAIRPPQRFATLMGLSTDALLDELTRLFCCYVGIMETQCAAPPPASSPQSSSSRSSRPQAFR